MKPTTVILDRDGVINYERESFVKSPAEWHPLPGSLQAIARLKHAGMRVAIASNQSGLARGLFEHSALRAIHHKMTQQLGELGARLDGIFICPHAENDHCCCRKPRPGLLQEIIRRWDLRACDCVMIGDSRRDIEAGQALGVPVIGVRTGKAIDLSQPCWANVDIFDDLAAAVAPIIAS